MTELQHHFQPQERLLKGSVHSNERPIGEQDFSQVGPRIKLKLGAERTSENYNSLYCWTSHFMSKPQICAFSHRSLVETLIVRILHNLEIPVLVFRIVWIHTSDADIVNLRHDQTDTVLVRTHICIPVWYWDIHFRSLGGKYGASGDQDEGQNRHRNPASRWRRIYQTSWAQSGPHPVLLKTMPKGVIFALGKTDRNTQNWGVWWRVRTLTASQEEKQKQEQFGSINSQSFT